MNWQNLIDFVCQGNVLPFSWNLQSIKENYIAHRFVRFFKYRVSTLTPCPTSTKRTFTLPITEP